jgi:hypothetical protein
MSIQDDDGRFVPAKRCGPHLYVKLM